MRWSIKVKRGVNDLHPSGYVCVSVTGSYSGIVKYLICTVQSMYKMVALP